VARRPTCSGAALAPLRGGAGASDRPNSRGRGGRAASPCALRRFQPTSPHARGPPAGARLTRVDGQHGVTVCDGSPAQSGMRAQLTLVRRWKWRMSRLVRLLTPSPARATHLGHRPLHVTSRSCLERRKAARLGIIPRMGTDPRSGEALGVAGNPSTELNSSGCRGARTRTADRFQQSMGAVSHGTHRARAHGLLRQCGLGLLIHNTERAWSDRLDGHVS
jgi:hypothetical protein